MEEGGRERQMIAQLPLNLYFDCIADFALTDDLLIDAFAWNARIVGQYRHFDALTLVMAFNCASYWTQTIEECLK